MFNSALAFTERLLPPLLSLFFSFFCSSASSCRAVVIFFLSSSFPVREGRHLRLRGESGSYHWLPFFFLFLFPAYVCRLFRAHPPSTGALSHARTDIKDACTRLAPDTSLLSWTAVCSASFRTCMLSVRHRRSCRFNPLIRR